jgi:hypothetical protein
VDGDGEREAGRAEAKYVGGHDAAQPAQESDLGCLAGQAIENKNFSCLGGVRLERKDGISGGVLPRGPHRILDEELCKIDVTTRAMEWC